MLRLRLHSFSFFSYGLKAKARAKDFLHIAFHLLYSEFEIQTQRLLVTILLFICCTRNLKFKHSICLLPYCSSFVVLGISNSNTASACCHNALHLLQSEFWLRSRKWKTDELQIKISNYLLTYCISTESCLYIISMI